MRSGDHVRSRAVAGVIVLAIVVLSGGPAAASVPGPGLRCPEPSPAGRGAVVRDPLEAPDRDPLAALRPSRAEAVADVTVEVAVHVLAIDGTAAGGWVADERLEQQIAVLNDAFAGTTEGASTRFRFELVSVDRTVKARWFLLRRGSRVEDRIQEALHTGGRATLNVYVADLQDGMLGWATYPWWFADHRAGDGVTIDLETLPGGAKAAYDEGDTLVHETGHWLGLFHTFEHGCDGDGDAVDDTPAEASPSTGCDEERDTCTADGLDPVANFMDYSPDDCMHAFTPGQAERMSAAWDAYRA